MLLWWRGMGKMPIPPIFCLVGAVGTAAPPTFLLLSVFFTFLPLSKLCATVEINILFR